MVQTIAGGLKTMLLWDPAAEAQIKAIDAFAIATAVIFNSSALSREEQLKQVLDFGSNWSETGWEQKKTAKGIGVGFNPTIYHEELRTWIRNKIEECELDLPVERLPPPEEVLGVHASGGCWMLKTRGGGSLNFTGPQPIPPIAWRLKSEGPRLLLVPQWAGGLLCPVPSPGDTVPFATIPQDLTLRQRAMEIMVEAAYAFNKTR